MKLNALILEKDNLQIFCHMETDGLTEKYFLKTSKNSQILPGPSKTYKFEESQK